MDTSLFKGDYPEEAISKIRDLENLHDTKFSNFKIIAPQELFRIKKADDPLLFAPMGNGYFYLIHKWGNDLHPLRKFKYWAIKNVTTLGLTALFISILFTALSYYISFNNQESAIAYTIVIFLFTFKSVVGAILFLGAASGKNFSEYSWQSKYDKIS
ncbi:hypothetical protein [Tenacibaculum sp. SG-28]|uniref:hypothetical protein n=1 Tax=Tenacibaculum sp. SG-28 TaxID=754426 RepID=UPI000CF50A88|nr:hypothetical protein [Tenacibaculum sp. SG-28]PQJ23390.1 hypothetical protein BSU00_04145 [Tenacibaculum sp. SG-28]